MGQLLDVAKQFFESDNWHYKDVPELGILTLNFKGDSGQWSCYVQARDENGLFAIYSISPLHAPEDKRLALSEYITRVNYNMAIGNFEMDMDDGEIRYKTSIDVTGDELTPALVRRLVYANLLNMDKYYPGVVAIAESDISPTEAIAKVERQGQQN